MIVIATFQRSEGMVETMAQRGTVLSHDDPATFERVVTLDTSDGPWVQLTYESLRDSRGEFVATLTEHGEWALGDDPHPYSDVVIEFRP